MRLAVVLLLVALVLIPDGDALGRKRRGKRWIRVRIRIGKVLRDVDTIVKEGRTIIGGKRDINSYDLNNDGNIDQSEAEEIFEKRNADEVLSLADKDGDSNLSVDEFQEALRKLTKRDVDLQKDLDDDIEN